MCFSVIRDFCSKGKGPFRDDVSLFLGFWQLQGEEKVEVMKIKGEEMFFAEEGFTASTVRYAGILLEVVSKTLEQKILKDRELERGSYEAAFNAGRRGFRFGGVLKVDSKSRSF